MTGVGTFGASAIYGSDAVGGVVNFILRQDFEGSETRLSGGMADDVDELRVSQIFGTSWESGSFVVSGEYFERDMLLEQLEGWMVELRRRRPATAG